MLETIKKFFTKQENLKDSVTEFYELDPATNPHFIAHPDKINKLLKEIEEESPLCTINIAGTNEDFNSSILDIQIDSQQIILDELSPKHGNKLLLKKNNLKLSTYLNGINLAFRLSKMKVGSSSGIAYYKTAIPDRIFYPQHRASPRIEIISLNIPFCGISSKTKRSVSGQLLNLSKGGIGISIFNNRTKLQRGDSILNCKITLDNYALDFKLTVGFVKTSKLKKGSTHIGGYFDRLPAKSQHKLEHFISSLEAEAVNN